MRKSASSVTSLNSNGLLKAAWDDHLATPIIVLVGGDAGLRTAFGLRGPKLPQQDPDSQELPPPESQAGTTCLEADITAHGPLRANLSPGRRTTQSRSSRMCARRAQHWGTLRRLAGVTRSGKSDEPHHVRQESWLEHPRRSSTKASGRRSAGVARPPKNDYRGESRLMICSAITRRSGPTTSGAAASG
jgi:hypothetical protein